MRLHRITLRDVKGVRERTVDLPDRGVVVIEGPNEVGKTTLVEAFDALLAFKASSKAAGVRALQPVGRDVGPFVEAEFTIGGTRVRFAKQWLRQPSTTLHVLGPRPEQLTGDLAQQRLDTLVKTHLDRPLWDALRLTQAGDGSVAPLAASSVLTQALDAAAGAQQHAEGADALLDAVSAEYSTYFTPTGRPTGDYKAALARHTAAELAVVEADRRVQEGAVLLRRLEEARAAVARADADLATAAERLAETERAGVAADEVEASHLSARERLRQAEQLHAASASSLARRQRLRRDVAALEAQVDAAREEREREAAEADQLAAAYQLATARLADAVLATERAETQVELTRADVQLLADTAELARRQQLHDHVCALVERLGQARAAMPERVVEAEVVRHARTLAATLEELSRQHDATSPVLEVKSLGAAVDVELGDGAGRTPVPAGGAARVVLSHDATVELPGQARLRVHLQGEAQARLTRLAEVRDELRATLDPLGCSDVEEAARLAEATERARGAVRAATSDVRAALGQHGTGLSADVVATGAVPPVLAEAVAEARHHVEDALAARPPERPLPTDARAARATAEEAGAGLRAARDEQRAAERAVTAARTAVTRLTTRLDRSAGWIEGQDAQLRSLQAQLEEERRELGDTDLAGEVGDRTARVRATAAVVDETARAMAEADVAGVRARLAAARDHHRRVVRAREDALAELHGVGGQVEMAAGEGREELRDLAVTELQEARRALAAVDRRARAARHLHGTLLRHRDSAHRSYVRPYTEALEELGRRVYGPGFAVVVDEQLGLEARTLDGVTVPFAELSGGAKEQLGILARLAVARLVDPVQGVPVVIDDALGYSDPERLRQMGEVLGAAGVADGLQVILLTCTPQRYAAVPDLLTVALTA